MVSNDYERGLIEWPDEIDSNFIKGIINAFPFDTHSLYGLVGIFDVKYSDAVPTASINMIGVPKILINREWVTKWVLSWSDMAAVIYHEITHKMLGHFSEIKMMENKGLSRYQINFLLDVRVQGLSYQIMNNPAYQRFWYRYYRGADYPLTLLSNMSHFEGYTVRRLHQEIYSPFGISLEKVADFVFGDDYSRYKEPEGGEGNGKNGGKSADNGGKNKNANNEPKKENNKENDGISDAGDGAGDDGGREFVGSHDISFDDIKIPCEKMMDHINDIKNKIETRVEKAVEAKNKEQAVKSLMAGNKIDNIDKSFGTGSSEFLVNLEDVENLYRIDKKMESKMLHIAVETEELKAKKAIKALFPDVPDIGTVPNFRDKRALVINMLGHWPVFFENMKEDPRGYCHVYIDNSGSQFNVISFVIKLFISLRDYLYPEVHFFSTIIWTINKSKLKPGMELKTTGGTDMNTVVEHALKNGIKKCLVITDGYGPLSDKNAELAHKAGQKYLIGFTEESHGDGFNKVAWREFNIPKETEVISE